MNWEKVGEKRKRSNDEKKSDLGAPQMKKRKISSSTVPQIQQGFSRSGIPFFWFFAFSNHPSAKEKVNSSAPDPSKTKKEYYAIEIRFWESRGTLFSDMIPKREEVLKYYEEVEVALRTQYLLVAGYYLSFLLESIKNPRSHDALSSIRFFLESSNLFEEEICKQSLELLFKSCCVNWDHEKYENLFSEFEKKRRMEQMAGKSDFSTIVKQLYFEMMIGLFEDFRHYQNGTLSKITRYRSLSKQLRAPCVLRNVAVFCILHFQRFREQRLFLSIEGMDPDFSIKGFGFQQQQQQREEEEMIELLEFSNIVSNQSNATTTIKNNGSHFMNPFVVLKTYFQQVKGISRRSRNLFKGLARDNQCFSDKDITTGTAWKYCRDRCFQILGQGRFFKSFQKIQMNQRFFIQSLLTPKPIIRKPKKKKKEDEKIKETAKKEKPSPQELPQLKMNRRNIIEMEKQQKAKIQNAFEVIWKNPEESIQQCLAYYNETRMNSVNDNYNNNNNLQHGGGETNMNMRNPSTISSSLVASNGRINTVKLGVGYGKDYGGNNVHYGNMNNNNTNMNMNVNMNFKNRYLASPENKRMNSSSSIMHSTSIHPNMNMGYNNNNNNNNSHQRYSASITRIVNNNYNNINTPPPPRKNNNMNTMRNNFIPPNERPIDLNIISSLHANNTHQLNNTNNRGNMNNNYFNNNRTLYDGTRTNNTNSCSSSSFNNNNNYLQKRMMVGGGGGVDSDRRSMMTSRKLFNNIHRTNNHETHRVIPPPQAAERMNYNNTNNQMNRITPPPRRNMNNSNRNGFVRGRTIVNSFDMNTTNQVEEVIMFQNRRR